MYIFIFESLYTITEIKVRVLVICLGCFVAWNTTHLQKQMDCIEWCNNLQSITVDKAFSKYISEFAE